MHWFNKEHNNENNIIITYRFWAGHEIMGWRVQRNAAKQQYYKAIL
jgi:hypothetical protein